MGGEDAQSGELPWAVLIELNMEGKVCGGTLVTRRHVITAAHCFWNGDDTPCKMSHAFREADIKKFTTIMIGGVCSKEDSKTHCEGHDVGTRYKIRNLYYESFFKTGCNSTQDFAIIELLEEVPKYIHHACLPHLHNIDMLDQRTAKFFTQGWGLNPSAPKGYEEIASPRLQKVDLGVKMTEDECRAEESGKKPDTFCTTEKSDVNVCHGDSGGGLTTVIEGRHFLMGLVSYGSACDDLLLGARPSAQIHTDINYYTADIDMILGLRVEDRKPTWERVYRKHNEQYNVYRYK
ncbi:hypothetical protein Q1695_015240 [Nippostrongylus brasiliensis]|nr:hypothetical protein Q1695_015240 [Nippostrongylus brasiliensis]